MHITITDAATRRVCRMAFWDRAVAAIGERFHKRVMWPENCDAEHAEVYREATIQVDVFNQLCREIDDLQGVEPGGSILVDASFAAALRGVHQAITEAPFWSVDDGKRGELIRSEKAARELLAAMGEVA